MDRIVAIRKVIHLACPPKVVYERIRTNTGGDIHNTYLRECLSI
ncbi:MAG: hypothetical protein ABIK15_21200 [Pseudomonadota bacterium]